MDQCPKLLRFFLTFALPTLIGVSVTLINAKIDSVSEFEPGDIATDQTPLRWLINNHSLAQAFEIGYLNAPKSNCSLEFADFERLNRICQSTYHSPETATECVNGVLCGATSYTVKAKFECNLRANEDRVLGIVSGLLASIVLATQTFGLKKICNIKNQCSSKIRTKHLFWQADSYGSLSNTINQTPVSRPQSDWCFQGMACFFYFVLITIVSMATASRNKAAFKNNDWHNPAQTPCSFQQELNNKTATDLCINAFNKASQLMQHQNWPVEYPLLNETHLCDDQYPCLNGLQTGLMAGITNLYLRNERDSSDVTIAVIATALLALSCIAVQLYQSKCVQSRSDRSTPPLMQINA